MFRGAAALNLDEKGRLAIPTKYRKSLMLDCEGQMVCTIDINLPTSSMDDRTNLGNCLFKHTMS